jgi:hypothetical protein
MAAAKAKSGSLDDLLEPAEPAFVQPIVVEAEEPQFHTADAKMTIAPEPIAEPEPEPAAAIAEPPAEQTPTPPAERPVKAEAIPYGWYDVDGAPQDGKPVVLLGPDDPPDRTDFPFVEAVWRNSRYFDRKCGRWQPTGFWAVRNCAGIKVAFTPVAWRPAL